jgi:hypothetical protein
MQGPNVFSRVLPQLANVTSQLLEDFTFPIWNSVENFGSQKSVIQSLLSELSQKYRFPESN